MNGCSPQPNGIAMSGPNIRTTRVCYSVHFKCYSVYFFIWFFLRPVKNKWIYLFVFLNVDVLKICIRGLEAMRGSQEKLNAFMLINGRLPWARAVIFMTITGCHSLTLEEYACMQILHLCNNICRLCTTLNWTSRGLTSSCLAEANVLWQG